MSFLQTLTFVLLTFQVAGCSDTPVTPTTAKTDDSNPAVAPALYGDALDPQFTANLTEVGQLLRLDDKQLLNLRTSMEKSPDILARLRLALLDLPHFNRELLQKQAKDFILLGDAKKLLAKILFLTGITNEQGGALKSIAFVSTTNQDISVLLIPKNIPISLRLMATYDGDAARRDVTQLAKIVVTGDTISADSIFNYLVQGSAIDQAGAVNASLGNAQAALTLTVRDGTVTYSASLTNEFNNATNIATLPEGMIGSMRVLAELKDFKEAVLSTSDVSESATFSANSGAVLFLQQQDYLRLLRKGLFAGSAAGAVKLTARFTFNGKAGEVVKDVTITPPEALFSYFYGPLVKEYLSGPEGLFCFGGKTSEDWSTTSDVFFVGDVVKPFSFLLFMSNCDSLDKTTDLGLAMAPPNAISRSESGWIATTAKKDDASQHVNQRITGTLTQTVNGADKTFPSTNSLYLNIRERLIGAVISDRADARPIASCFLDSGNAEARSQPKNWPAEFIPIYAWFTSGPNDCLVVEDVSFGGTNPDLMQLTLSVPDGTDPGRVGRLSASQANVVIELNANRGTEPLVLIVTGTYDLTARCGASDTVCRDSAISTKTMQLTVPGGEPEREKEPVKEM